MSKMNVISKAIRILDFCMATVTSDKKLNIVLIKKR